MLKTVGTAVTRHLACALIQGQLTCCNRRRAVGYWTGVLVCRPAAGQSSTVLLTPWMDQTKTTPC